MLKHKTSICFSQDDLALFSKASLDRNPLHLSDDYAHKTPFAKRVVFGVLGGIFCLGHLQNRPGLRLSQITMEFPAPLFVDLPYSLEVVDTSPEKAVMRIYDGRRLMSKVTAYFQAGSPARLKTTTAQATRSEAAVISLEDLTTDISIEETYCPDANALRQLTEPLHLLDKGVGELETSALLWASYFVGMELPGCRALFSKLKLNFNDSLPNLAEPISYKASLVQFDDRYNLLRTKVNLSANSTPLASGSIQSFIRSNSPTVTTASIEELLPRSEALKGKVAFITGASRGLGAAIAQSLALQGCTVLVNFLRSRSEAENLQATLADSPGEIVLMQGDAADLSWCLSAKQDIEDKYGTLDFLICNACPAILPLWIEPSAIERLNEYAAKSLALMSVPMSVFLDLVSDNLGWNVIISSIYASEFFPPELPHYVVSKFALEGLTQVAAAEYDQTNFLVVRPPKLLTDQTNTPIGQQGAIAAEKIAVKIVERLKETPSTKPVEVMEAIWN
ncbi:MAG: SDR family NAD(P)-dependent oxidoreductase [Leptolyngbya sp. SIO1D8]|nr:SDR family NAD(P)-dependent oxidoreductase [Leptolyngbya sp. SIO1D8]